MHPTATTSPGRTRPSPIPAVRPRPRPRSRPTWLGSPLPPLLSLVAALVLASCAEGSTADAEAPTVARPLVATADESASAMPAPAPAEESADLRTAADAPSHAVAIAQGPITVHERPDPASGSADLSATTPLGADRAFRVVEATGDGTWLEVRVPSRPNNTDGWVRTDEVRLVAVRHHIEIDLSERTLVLREAGEPILTTTVAVGTSENPTPTGTFFITDKLATDPDGAYGPHAFGVSAWSETLSEFAGGDGQIGLHGTNRPELLGDAVSHGCIRVGNDVIVELAGLLPLGVPVDIRA